MRRIGGLVYEGSAMPDIVIQCSGVDDVYRQWINGMSKGLISDTDDFDVMETIVFLDDSDHPCILTPHLGTGNDYIWRAGSPFDENPDWRVIMQAHGWHTNWRPEWHEDYGMQNDYLGLLADVAPSLLEAACGFMASWSAFTPTPLVINVAFLQWKMAVCIVYLVKSLGSALNWNVTYLRYDQVTPYELPFQFLTISHMTTNGGPHDGAYVYQLGFRSDQLWPQINPTDVLDTAAVLAIQALADALNIHAGSGGRLFRGRQLRAITQVPTDIIIPASDGTLDVEVERLAKVCEKIGRTTQSVIDTTGSVDVTTGIVRDIKGLRG
jgi:hypothetical protein